VTKSIELRRHTANDGDVLTADGIAEAVRIGAALRGPYDLVVSSGAQRATQAAACFIAGSGLPVPGGVVVLDGLRSEHEDRWRDIYSKTRNGELAAFLEADRSFVELETERFIDALRGIAALVPNGGRALAVGHSPMIEAAVWGATGRTIAALGKGDGVVVVCDGDAFTLHE
jgi:broad specificity phosphatase PhoE